MNWLISLLVSASCAAEEPKPLTLAIADLVPVGYSLYHTANPSTLRYYLRFKNSLGNHFFVYEEDSTQPISREAHALLEAAGNYESSCLVNLECAGKPFCTGDCQNMYYQITNLATPAPDSSRCQVLSFTCAKRVEAGPAIPAPAVALPVTPAK